MQEPMVEEAVQRGRLMAVGQRQNLWGEEAGIQHEAPARLRGALGQLESAQLGQWGLRVHLVPRLP